MPAPNGAVAHLAFVETPEKLGMAWRKLKGCSPMLNITMNDFSSWPKLKLKQIGLDISLDGIEYINEMDEK